MASILTAGSELEKFWQWWTRQLGLLVPPKLLSLLGAERKHPLKLYLQNTQMYLQETASEGERIIASFTLDAEGQKQQQRFFAEHPQFAGSEKILHLCEGQALSRRITLPLAAQDNLRQVLGYEMNRYTPFTEQELYYAVQVIAKNKEARQLIVELIAVPRNILNDMHDVIRDLGIEIHAAVYDGAETGGYNLLPAEMRPKIDRRPILTRNILAGTVVVLLIAALALPINLKSQYLDELQEQTTTAAKKVKDIEKIKTGAQALFDNARKLAAQKQNEPSMLKVLNELTRLLPKDTWLSSFQYANHKVQIQGLSASASALIGILEASPYFDDAGFISPVIPDRQSGQDRFQIAMNVIAPKDANTKPE